MFEAEPLDTLLQGLASPQSNGWLLQISCGRSGYRARLLHRLRRWDLPKFRRRCRLMVFVEANNEMDLGVDVPGWPMISQVDDDGLGTWGSRCGNCRRDCTYGRRGSVHGMNVTPSRSAADGSQEPATCRRARPPRKESAGVSTARPERLEPPTFLIRRCPAFSASRAAIWLTDRSAWARHA